MRLTLLSQNAAGDTERPYDLLSIMHYDADSFSTSKKPTITAKDKAYALYTDDPDDYDMYRMGNRVGLTQLDADQLADLYRDVNLGLWLTWLKHSRLVWHILFAMWQCVKTLYPCSSHQNSWDLWMFIPLKMVLIGIDP